MFSFSNGATGIDKAREILADFPFRTPQQIGFLDNFFYCFLDFCHFQFRNRFGKNARIGQGRQDTGEALSGELTTP